MPETLAATVESFISHPTLILHRPLAGILTALLFACLNGEIAAATAASPPLKIHWEKNYLTIAGDQIPGPVTVHYIEAYCRPGSTHHEWSRTRFQHTSELIAASADRRVIKTRDTLPDGVVFDHTITASHDEVDFRVVARNPTSIDSVVTWAQPCMRVDLFTGCSKDDARTLVPAYARQSFLFIGGKLTMLPTQPWADQACYVPGQVYASPQADRNDVNPRPLSALVPSSGLCGSFSKDRRQIVATAWEPYQEIFQGVIACMHNDFRIGGLKAGETKIMRGKIYFVPADVPALVSRFERDFPEQAGVRR